MKKFYFILFLLLFSINTFSVTFLDPVVNRVLVYIDKDSANNYAFIKGMSEHDEKKVDKFISLGIVGSSIEPRFKDKKDYYTVVPMINGKYKNFYTFGGIYNGYNFYEGKNLDLNFTAEYSFLGRVEDDFDSYFKELDELDSPIMLGISGSYKLNYAFLTGGINHNIRGNRNENTASIGVLSGIPFKKFILLGFVNYKLMSNSFTDKYFGIPDKPYNDPITPYEVNGIGQALQFTGALAYSFSRHIDLFAYYYFETFSDNIKNSTLTTGKSSHMFGIGGTYTF